jgi:hypothetical protein
MHEKSLENLKRTLRIATSKFEPQWTPDFGNQRWEQLRHSRGLRDRITHPKTAAKLVISDDELDAHRSGFAWYLETTITVKEMFDGKYQ